MACLEMDVSFFVLAEEVEFCDQCVLTGDGVKMEVEGVRNILKTCCSS